MVHLLKIVVSPRQVYREYKVSSSRIASMEHSSSASTSATRGLTRSPEDSSLHLTRTDKARERWGAENFQFANGTTRFTGTERDDLQRARSIHTRETSKGLRLGGRGEVEGERELAEVRARDGSFGENRR